MADVIDSGHSKPPPADTRLSTEHVSDLSLLGLSASVLVTWFPFSSSRVRRNERFSSAGSRSSWSSSRKYQFLPRGAAAAPAQPSLFELILHLGSLREA
ncbi:hypothetical protein HPP92_004009 [Vanilla planifolia]|uniref:Uncharacterized protein n=1 Tax=Vanilla planifolia TaxID=51239 RepID=A0A835RYQ2_VANPL|nr:hypothetical protein HPP92_004009 [Vanilla planifolia]